MKKKIKDLLKSKLKLIQDFQKYTDGLTGVLKEGDTQKLLEVLNMRQQLIKKIDSIDSELLSFFDGDFNNYTKHIVTSEGELKKIHEDIVVILKKIRKSDDESIKGIQKLHSELKEDIYKLREAENALKGYGFMGKSLSDGAFIDTKK